MGELIRGCRSKRFPRAGLFGVIVTSLTTSLLLGQAASAIHQERSFSSLD